MKSLNFLVIKGKFIWRLLAIAVVIGAATIWYSFQSDAIPAMQNKAEKIREIHLITNELKTTTEDGKEIEIYRWDPGTIYVKKGEKVNLKLFGVYGKEHPFIIEGTNIQGTVKKGEETVIPVQFEKEGVYRLICVTHLDYDHHGPMIAHIIVED